MKNFFVILFIKGVSFFLKIFGKNGGNLPGKLAFKLNPNILKCFKIDCPVIAVTGTNGKTMTNNCIVRILEDDNKRVISNLEGNNMETGIVSTLIKKCSLTGKIKADYLVLETDESYVPIVYKDLKLDCLVVLNFFRDQLDRSGEVESLILKINEFLKTYDKNLILNSDDPNVSRLAMANPENKNIYYYSVDRYKFATDELREAGEGKFCPFCNTRLKYKYYQYAHVGKFICDKCNYGGNEIYNLLENVDLENRSFEIDGTTYTTKFNSIYSTYNFAAATTVCKLYNTDLISMKNTLENFVLNNGRLEKMVINNNDTIINIAKNPTGANVSLRLVNEDNEHKEILFVLNDNIADGKDVSWIWDINFDVLNNVDRIITSGTRAFDLAIRIKTSNYPVEKIEAYTDIYEAIEHLYEKNTKKYVITNYTATQDTRHKLMRFKEKCGDK